ncbi:hypothetical protein FK529_11225 [Tsukamurella asaccharolytica]|uniref:Uncharacterized protein n=1 Tax=Tsukamurella asaccharolytica TaxID=2592067 RepID=A0A5C5R800_9ACTN|nr:hypothetical protein [Tsukamurella asaccharolytica]TWS19080.1 hypothetical protein FK529_11225 [Tsukamurella asaccharolytica]
MSELESLLATMERIAETVNRFDDDHVQRKAFKLLMKAAERDAENAEGAAESAREWEAHAAHTRPANNREKIVVAAAHLAEVGEEPTPGRVFDLFADAGWKVPVRPEDTLQQTAAAGWIGLEDGAVTVTDAGERLIDALPR